MSRLGSSSIVRREGRCMNMLHGPFLGLYSLMSVPYVHGLPGAVTVHDRQVHFIRGSRISKANTHGAQVFEDVQ